MRNEMKFVAKSTVRKILQSVDPKIPRGTVLIAESKVYDGALLLDPDAVLMVYVFDELGQWSPYSPSDFEPYQL